MLGKINISILIYILVILNVCKANAQITPISAAEQAILFKKIFTYVKTLENPSPTVLLVYDSKSEYPKDLIDAFTKEDINVIATHPNAIDTINENIQVVYIVAGVSAAGISKIFSLENKLFISGEPEYIIEGKASVGVGKDMEEERYKILINLSTLAKNSHEISSELISLAKIIK